jgi:hypothetical protein
MIGLAAVALLCSAGCIEEQRYHVVDQTVELTADAQPAYVTEDDEPVYRVDRGFSLRITRPSQAALQELAASAQGMMLRYPRLPWVKLHDLELQLDYALSNDSEQMLVALITLNGVNEFHFYAPGPENFHQWERRVALAPHQRVHGTVTEVELDEIAVDLATVVNGAPNSNLVVEARSQSSLDERVRPFIPPVVPGLVGVRAGLETMVAAPLTLELSIRVQDHGERAAKRGEQRWELPAAQPFAPVVPDLE